VIGKSCFTNCKSLTRLTFEFPSKLSCIESMAFYNCTSLESVSCPALLEEIGSSCFYNCPNLDTVQFANGSNLSHLEESAFELGVKLSSFCIGSSTEVIGKCCFCTLQSRKKHSICDRVKKS
jgi:hypothetical protein